MQSRLAASYKFMYRCSYGAEPLLACMQVMSIWPFKQMILRAQLKQFPIPKAQSRAPHSVDRGSSPGSTSASSSSSSQTTISVPRDLVQQKLSGGGSSAQSHAQPANESSADSAASPASESGPAQGVERGDGARSNHGADVQNSPDIQGSPGVQSSPGTQGSPHIQGRVGAAGSSPGEPLQTDYLFHFGDTTEIRKALEMPNRLTG